MTNEPQPLEGILVSAEADLGGTLVAVQSRPTLEIFTAPGVVPALLASVRDVALQGYAPDTSTDKGRKAIASLAFKVAKTKTALDGLGQEEVARLKELPKKVDAGRKALRDGLDALRDEIRQPLTDWEARVEAIKARLTDLQNLPARLMNATAAIIGQALTDLQAVDPASFDEFADEARGIITATAATVQEQLEKRQKWEADQAELERLRKAEEDRKQQEREEALRKEGEERARKAAEAAAARTLEGHPAHINAAAVMAAAPQDAADQQAQPPAVAVPLPLETADALRRGETVPAFLPAPPDPAADLEHRRAFNREALADMAEALVLANIFTKDAEGRQAAETTAKAVLTAIVTGKVRHLAIAY